MAWQVTSGVDEAVWTEQYLYKILSSHARRPMPPFSQHIGSVLTTWQELDPGVFSIQTAGGTIADRHLAHVVVESQLSAYGLQQAEFYLGGPELRKTAAWPDVEEKAMRLIQEGKVQVTGNTPNIITGHVIGDNGAYLNEIKRDDPNSDSITTWSCDCPWNQFAWQRTRKWKKYEGRVCSHVLATYWLSRSMPIDQEYDPATGQPIDANGQLGMDLGALPRSGPAPKAPVPRGPTPLPNQQLSIPGVVPGQAEAIPLPPQPLPIIPQQPAMKPPVAVSVPGAKQPDATNPTQYPGGTFSSWKFANELLYEPWTPGQFGKGTFIDDEPHAWTTDDYGSPHHHDIALELTQDMDASPRGYFHIQPDGTVEAQGTGDAQEFANTDSRFKVAEESDWKFAAEEVTFNNSDMVRINEEEMGIAEGKSEAHGSGQYRPIKKNSIGEVLGQDPSTGWVDVIFPIHDSGPMEPYHIRAWIEPDKLTPMPGVAKPGPFIRRRAATDPYLYHVAPTSERQRIKAHGLMPSNPGQSGQWGEDSPFVNSPTGVYVFIKEEDAMHSGIFEGAPVDVWRVAKSSVRGLEMDPVIENAYVLKTHVPAELHVPWEHRDQLDEKADDDMTWRDWHENDHQEDPDEYIKTLPLGQPLTSSWTFG